MEIKEMKIKVQVQHLKSGDIVGSGEKVFDVIVNSIHWPSNKVHVTLSSKRYPANQTRSVLWGKYTMINVEREADGV